MLTAINCRFMSCNRGIYIVCLPESCVTKPYFVRVVVVEGIVHVVHKSSGIVWHRSSCKVMTFKIVIKRKTLLDYIVLVVR